RVIHIRSGRTLVAKRAGAPTPGSQARLMKRVGSPRNPLRCSDLLPNLSLSVRRHRRSWIHHWLDAQVWPILSVHHWVRAARPAAPASHHRSNPEGGVVLLTGLSRSGTAIALTACALISICSAAAWALIIGPDGPLVGTAAAEYEPDIAVVGDRALAVWQPF